MKLSQRKLNQFKSFFKKYFDEDLTNKEALKKAEKLIEIYSVVYDVPAIVGSRTKLLNNLPKNNYEIKNHQ